MLPHIHREICLPGIHSPEQADVAWVTTATAICRERPRLIRIAIAALYADDQAQKQALLPSEPGAVFRRARAQRLAAWRQGCPFP
jgi:hypothetical protein